MAEPPKLDILLLLQDEKYRRVVEYLLENLTASTLKLSYDLRMPPDEVQQVLDDMTRQGLVETRARQMPGAAYTLTEKAQQLRPYLPSHSIRQQRRL